MKNWKQGTKLEKKSNFFLTFCFLNKLNGGFNYGRNKLITNKLLQERRNEESQKNDGRKTGSRRNFKKC